MHGANPFRHQEYHTEPPSTPYRLVTPQSPARVDSADYAASLQECAGRLVQVPIAAIYCVHGTFTGNDLLGLLTELQRFSPHWSEQLRRCTKGVVDLVAGETGNYTRQYVERLSAALSQAAGREIPVRRFHWSGQNNHIARVDGAVRLIAELAALAEQLSRVSRQPDPAPRVLLWGHSHGGNVLALVSRLLGADSEARQEFFATTRCFYNPWLGSRVDLPAWPRVAELLAEPQHPLRALALDLVTFGTPIRYGWDAGGCAQLLHFVNHRPSRERPPYQTAGSLRLGKFLAARDGDYIHQIGIAGSNFLPLPLAPRTLLADCRLHQLLQRGTLQGNIVRRIRCGLRVPDAGTTLLVDYGDASWNFPRHLAGHAVYTRSEWLPFHLAEIARHCYSVQ